eukprot:COSAG05_NODE_4610_length_1440_cov_0.975391_3_plen_125_part_00
MQNDEIGHTAKQSEPKIVQVFLEPLQPAAAEESDPTVRLEKMCYLLRKRTAKALFETLTEDGREWSSGDFYWCALFPSSHPRMFLTRSRLGSPAVALHLPFTHSEIQKSWVIIRSCWGSWGEIF